MTMTDSPTETPVVKKKKKPRKKARRASFHKPADKPAAPEFAGLTATDCAKACSADGCVISGSIYCAHPRKGGLQGRDMHDPAALGRMHKAQKMLALETAEKRFS